MKLSEELTWRGFVNQTTFEDITDLDKEKRIFYWGVDPSAPSMTVGNLAAAMMVNVFIKHGHKPVLLVGGATGLIGDPDGKAQERDLKTYDEVKKNKASLIEQYKRIFKNKDFKIVDNYDWFKDIGYIEFLRDIGKHVPMRQMLARDFVQSRLKEGGSGISYAEFSYSLMQGYDFLYLFEKYGVTLQLSGADQWGNSIAGVDLIRRKTGREAHVWTLPLLVNKATGIKFGKSEDGAVWLDAKLTSPYRFYQFWLNTDDNSVCDYLKIFTRIEKDELEQLMKEFEIDRSSRKAQKYLAYEVTKLIHGKDVADSVVKASEVLFGKVNFKELSNKEIDILKRELPTVQAQSLLSTIVTAGLASSKSEATRFVQSGAIYVNGRRVESVNFSFKAGTHLLKRGKNSFAIVECN